MSTYWLFQNEDHGPHDWKVAGHETALGETRLIGSDRPATPEELQPTERGLVRMTYNATEYYIVRACQICPKVWWQRYEPSVAMEATAE